ncbi:hypothetical protein HAX54_014543 [Datura stramonium]|uniref:Uncharacterized protein n=1 Tax=Datura stramonium TaxID=4076 RepID=A0ABS8TQ25_DATST|nr:hypothetical protein [Datura stramonium]
MSSLNLASTNNNRSYRSDKEELWRWLTLYRALLRGDQRDFEQIARSLCPHIPLIEAMYVSMSKKITGAGDTGLHVLVGAGKWFDDLMNRPRMIISVLTLRNSDGHTPLCVAAMVGNMKAAKVLLQLEMELPPNVRAGIDAVGPYPIIEAVRYGHKEMVLLLIGDYVAKKLEGSPPTKQSTTSLFLHLLVVAGFYDLLLALVRYHPVLTRTDFYGGDDESLLSLMAEKPSAFWSGTQLGFWHRLLYSGSIRTMFILSRAIVFSSVYVLSRENYATYMLRLVED